MLDYEQNSEGDESLKGLKGCVSEKEDFDVKKVENGDSSLDFIRN